MPSVRLRLFGAPLMQGPAGEQALGADRLGQAAFVLAVRGDWVTRDELVGLLWPDLPAAAARRNLRKVLFRGRRTPWFGELEARADSLRWRVTSDLREFEGACARGDWETAAATYAAPFADGLDAGAPAPFAQWLHFEQHRLAARLRAAAAARLGQLGGDAAARTVLARQWLAIDPLDEDALVAAAGAARALGQPGEVRRLAAAFRERLAREIGVEASARVIALTGDAVVEARGARPATDADFVGRRAERMQLQALLDRDECRVLTLVGPGGVGKSRLARVVLAWAAPRFETAAWIAMDDLTGAVQVAPRIVDVLRLPPSGQADARAQVTAALAGARALLVLDNAEHLDGLAGVCESLVQRCAGLKLMLTSRARLAIEGEWVLPLAGLPVPDEGETDPDVLRTFDAVQLFERRAAALSPDVVAAAGRHAAEVARLVRVLDGAPLAIELAAAWVRVLPVAEIRREIEGSLDLLAGRERAPDRQRSVRASFEHSWRLLSPVERHTLASLSVFASPFSRDAAAQVAGARLPVLAALVDKSLLRALGDGRFAFHPLMQQCARERLDDAGPVRQAHAAFFARWLARVAADGIGRGTVMGEIDSVLEDCRGAWRHAVDTRAGAVLQSMAPVLGRFFELTRRHAEGIELFATARNAIDAAPAGARAAVLLALGTMQYRAGELAVAEQTIRAAEGAVRAAHHAVWLRQCALLLGMIAWTRGEAAAARPHFDRALRLARRTGDETGCAKALNALAACARSAGRFEQALVQQRESLQLHERAGNVQEAAVVLNDMGTLLAALRRHGEAREFLARGLALSETHRLTLVREYCLLNLALTEIELGQLDLAQARLEDAMRADRGAGSSPLSVLLRLGAARVAMRRGDAAAARPLLQVAAAGARALASVPMQLLTLAFLAEWLLHSGQRIRAAALWRFLAGHPQFEAPDRANARDAADRMQLSEEEAGEAARTAAGFEAGPLLDALSVELSA
jgi:predicted ATPase/Tfp pilus assembly protein PilF